MPCFCTAVCSVCRSSSEAGSVLSSPAATAPRPLNPSSHFHRNSRKKHHLGLISPSAKQKRRSRDGLSSSSGSSGSLSLNLQCSHLLFQLVDPLRPFLLYELELDPPRFSVVQQEQQLLVQFSEFPGRVAELVELCRSDPRLVFSLHPRTFSQPNVSDIGPPMHRETQSQQGRDTVSLDPFASARSDPQLNSHQLGQRDKRNHHFQEGLLLEIVETNEFRRLQYLCLEFRLATDAAIKSHLARQLSSLTKSRANLERRLDDAQGRLRTERELRKNLSHKLEKQEQQQQLEEAAWKRQGVEQKDLERSLRRWEADNEGLRGHVRHLETEVSTLAAKLEQCASQAAAQQAESLQQLELMQLEIRKGNAIIQRQHMALKRTRQQISDLRSPQSLDMAPFPLHPPVLMEQPRQFPHPSPAPRQFMEEFQPTFGSSSPPVHQQPQTQPHPGPPDDQRSGREDEVHQLKKELETANARISDNLKVIEWLNREMNKAKQWKSPRPPVPIHQQHQQQLNHHSHHAGGLDSTRVDLEELQDISHIQSPNPQGQPAARSGHSLGEELFPPAVSRAQKPQNVRGGESRGLPSYSDGMHLPLGKAKLK